MSWPTADQRRSSLIQAAGKLLVQHWPDADDRCRLCRTVGCVIIDQATAYIEGILRPAIPSQASTVAILARAATAPTGALPVDLLRRTTSEVGL